jgi:hypothetical protein
MRLLILIVTLFSEISIASVIIESKKATPEVNSFTSEPEIKLPKEALLALKKWNSKFKPFSLSAYTPAVKKLFTERAKNEVPMAFVADLNGDKVEDVAILGQDEKKQYAIVLMNKKNKWSVSVANTWEFSNVEKSEVPGEYEVEYGVPFYILPSQSEEKGLQVETYLGSSKVYKF